MLLKAIQTILLPYATVSFYNAHCPVTLCYTYLAHFELSSLGLYSLPFTFLWCYKHMRLTTSDYGTKIIKKKKQLTNYDVICSNNSFVISFVIAKTVTLKGELSEKYTSWYF